MSDAFHSQDVTTPDYWDCNCEKDYIHSKNEKVCTVCGARSEDKPDSRAFEVVQQGLPLYMIECPHCQSWIFLPVPRQKGESDVQR